MKSSALKRALSIIDNLKEVDVSNRDVVDVSDRTGVRVLTIGAFLALLAKVVPHDDQRNHELRIAKGRAAHVREFHIAHTEIVVCFFKNQWKLTDGNHRSFIWETVTAAKLPSHVTLIVKAAKTEEEYLSLYECYDSSKAKKTSRDNFYGYCRHNGLTANFASEILRDGAIASALHRLAQSKSPNALRETVGRFKVPMLELDKLGLRQRQVPMGVILSALQLFETFESELAHAYLRELITVWGNDEAPVRKATSQAKAAMLNWAGRYNKGKFSGEEAIDGIARVVNEFFALFASEIAFSKKRAGTRTTASRKSSK
jgi:hypothetical protein